MTCGEFIDLISDFLGEELSPESRKMLEEHLCGCPSCEVSVQEFQATIMVTRALGRCGCDPLPPTVEARLRAVIDVYPPASRT